MGDKRKGDKTMVKFRPLGIGCATALLLMLPTAAVAQAREEGVALQGTNLTYYPKPDVAQCQADCANNPNCRGFTWIRAGTYNPGDSAMCYLVSVVTGRSPARGHISMVMGPRGGDGKPEKRPR
jgi:hypothetical protein